MEPAGEMSTAGKHAIKGSADECERSQAEYAYSAMLKAALGDVSQSD
jgi:hypothetical protein